MAPVTARQFSACTTAPIGDRFTDAQFSWPGADSGLGRGFRDEGGWLWLRC